MKFHTVIKNGPLTKYSDFGGYPVQDLDLWFKVPETDPGPVIMDDCLIM